MSLRSRILLLVALATFLPAALFGLFLLDSRESEVRESTLGLAALAAYGAQDLGNKISGTVQLLYGLSRAPDLDTDDRARCSDFLAEVLARYPQYTGLLTINPDGQLRCDSLRSGRSLDLNDRAYFKRALVSTEPVFEPVFGRLTGIAVMQIAFPVRNHTGALRYVLLASLNLAQFATYLAGAGAHPQMAVLIWDDRGTLLVQQPDDGLKLAGKAHEQSPLYRFLSSAPAGATAESPGLDGSARFWALSVLPGDAGSALRITLGIPRDILLARADRALRQAIATLAGVTLAVFVAALLIAELGIRRHLVRIAAAASRQRAGMLDARIGGTYPSGELGELMQALDSTAAAVQQQQAEIESQSKALVDANRTLRMLSAVSSAMVRFHDRDALLTEACRIAAVEGKFPVAWAGFIDAGSKQVVTAACYGVDRGDLAADGSAARLTRMAGAPPDEVDPVVVTASDPEFPDVAGSAALRMGSRAVAMFALHVSDSVTGVFVLHASEPDSFDAKEISLLRELAGDVAFALAHIDKSEKLDYLAHFDPLTGLANRTLFHERVRQCISADHDGKGVAVVLANIERFRRINDTLGRAAGDELLRQVGARAASVVSNQNHLSRIGVDLFAYIMTVVDDKESLGKRVERAHRTIFDQPFNPGDAELRISARYGIAMYPADGHDADALIRNAEAAMKTATGGGERFLFYESAMSEHLAEKLARESHLRALESQLRMALTREEFRLHYQPKIDCGTRRIVGVEALLRWQSPELGLVPPLDFIPLLEEVGLIVEVGNWVLSQAARDQREWREAGWNAPRIAVNVSPIQLDRRDFVQIIENAIAQGGPGTAIDLEITESSVMDNIEENMRKLGAIHALGVDIAIDDFGTGHSSLAYLTKLPVQALKIDRSFIVKFLADRHTMTMVSTIISLAHSLRLSVIAEGVETEDQARTLHLLRCDHLQGFVYSRPLPKHALTALLATHMQAQK